MLKRKISQADFNALPDALKTYYKQEGEDYILQVDGMVPSEKLTEFRDSNIQLKKDLEKFKDLDPEKYRDLLAKEADIIAGKTKDGKTVDQLVEERVATMKKESDKKIKELEEDRARKDSELNRLKITEKAVEIAQKKGLRPSASEDLKMRAERVFKLNEQGQPVYMEGDKVKFGKNGDPMGLDEWLDGLVTEAAHLFEASSGTGAGGGNTTGSNGKQPNPWHKDSRNLTLQGQILKKDPALAKRLKAEAGVA